MQCKATSKRSGERCKRYVAAGKYVCSMHGGKSLAGPESPTWKTGGDSKFKAIFTGDALEHYEAARKDDRYLEMREDLAVLDALFYEELKSARLGQGGALMEELAKHWTRFQEAQPLKDATTAGRALKKIGDLIAEGVSRQAAQTHALDIQDRKRRTSETERKRIVDQERTITQVQAMSFVAGMISLMREAVAGENNEREILARFHGGTARLVREYVAGGAGGLPTA